MGQLATSYLEAYAKNCKIFIETGTYQGQTLELALNFGFEELHSIEIDQTFFKNCVNKFKSNPQVTLHHGDSPDVLQKIMPGMQETCVFWLDAHKSTLLGTPQSPQYGPCPLLQELDAITLSPVKNHIIFIDDCRLFDRPNWNFLRKDQVLAKLFSINADYKIKYLDGGVSFGVRNPTDDILVAYL